MRTDIDADGGECRRGYHALDAAVGHLHAIVRRQPQCAARLVGYFLWSAEELLEFTSKQQVEPFRLNAHVQSLLCRPRDYADHGL